ncbi:MAG TPA: DUF1127 domain-containing protein [Geminicoccus sp.]|uniref:DUF1127 domain-containing protein n=1 Tax=Geminicoccus sp. TaxID=2024832 RepID=UPI002E32EF2C|nr:DUF1127 domain-containing protein [Geminicoccus sp.]HEX2526628.1 DUF1127 domain-containing protein [Geminicoccus sp.]
MTALAALRLFDARQVAEEPVQLVHPWAGLARLVTSIRRMYRAQRAIRELAALDDHLLRDLGLTRNDIERMAWSGRDPA